MAQFDWQGFLDKKRIEYATRGPSTSKDNIYCHCPFCGDADQGRHMGISLLGRGWGCWREQSHRGVNPARLIQALTGCGWDEAIRTAGGKKSLSGAGSGLLSAVQGALGKGEEAASRPALEMPPSFKRFRITKGPHYQYMRERGFTREDVETLVDLYDLRQCAIGDKLWSWRVIIPILSLELELQTWTARAVADAKIRYRTLTVDPEKAAYKDQIARGPITDYLLNAKGLLKGGEFLVLVEGPFDAMNLSLHAEQYDAQASCLFGKAISAAQMDWLAILRPLYKRVFLLLDPDASVSAMRMGSQLRALNVEPVMLKGEDDPGEMSPKAIRRLLRSMAARVDGSGNKGIA